MRPLAAVFVFAVLLALSGCGQKALAPFTPSEGGFTVLMPGTPARSTRVENGMTMTIYEAGPRSASFAVSSSVIPPSGVDLDSAVSGLAESVEGRSTHSGGVGGNTDGWREFEIAANNGCWFYSGRVLAARGNFYCVLAAGSDAKLSNARVRSFIDSFRLSEGATPGTDGWRPGSVAPTLASRPSPPAFNPPALGAPSDSPPPAPPAQASLPNPTLGAFRPEAPEEKIVGNPFDTAFRDEAPAGGWLVGFDVWYTKFVNNDIIGAVRPIFWANNAYVLGQIHGTATQRGVRMLAKPNYAVGAVTVRTGLGLDALTVTFMKVKGEWLDKSDSYLSEQMGGNGGGPTDIDGNGAPVTGIVGRTGTNISAFGLTYRGTK